MGIIPFVDDILTCSKPFSNTLGVLIDKKALWYCGYYTLVTRHITIMADSRLYSNITQQFRTVVY